MKATTTTVTKREEMDDENTAGAKIAVTLPVTAKAYPSTANIAPIGVTAAFDGFGVIMGFVGMQTTTSAVLRPTATNGAFLGITTYSATVPSTWATNHELTATFTYEAA